MCVKCYQHSFARRSNHFNCSGVFKADDVNSNDQGTEEHRGKGSFRSLVLGSLGSSSKFSIFPFFNKGKKTSTKSSTASSHDTNSSCSYETAVGEDSCPSLSSFRLQKDDIRVLVFRDCDRKGRKVLFDSKTVVRIPLIESPTGSSCTKGQWGQKHKKGAELGSSFSSHWASSKFQNKGFLHCGKQSSETKVPFGDSFVEVRNGFGYQYQKEASDCKTIGELVFGAVALAYKGSCSKLHIMKNPSSILMSRISPSPYVYKSPQTSCDTGIDDSFGSHSISISDAQDSFQSKSCLKLSWPVESPSRMTSCYSEDSGISAPASPFSTLGSFLSPNTLPCTPMGTPSSNSGSGNSLKNSGSLSGLQRRFLRNVTTSLESFAFFSGDEEQRDERPIYSSQSKLGVSVVINTHQNSLELRRKAEDWCFIHEESIDLSFSKLHSAVESAYFHRSTFVSSIFKAVEQFQSEMDDLKNAPRLIEPLWLNLLVSDSLSSKVKIFDRLKDSLAFLLFRCDTKHTNFFMSKLLTAVLTHHLGWVSTVTPTSPIVDIDENIPLSCSDKNSSTFVLNMVNCFPELQPYNALWSQLCELTGIVGYPSRAARTVLVGKDKTILHHMLVFLSYLIRCSQVIKKSFGDVRNPHISDSPEPPPPRSYTNKSSCSSIVTITDPSSSSQEMQLLRARRGRVAGQKCHSWRENDSNSSNLFSNPVSLFVRDGHRDCDREGKWMLNDECIVINPPPVENTSLHSEEGTNKYLKVPHLTVSKTMSDLSSLVDEESNEINKCNKTQSLYPSLTDMEDHRETFGIQPDVIAEKVKKLVRVPNNHSSDTFKHSSSNFQPKPSNRIIFTLGNEQIKIKPKPQASRRFKSDRLVRHRVSLPGCPAHISVLPKLRDSRRIIQMTTQGKSAEPEMLKDSQPYPSLEELKKEFNHFNPDLSSINPIFKTHKRNKSDPINGATLSRMPSYFEALGGVTEEKNECEVVSSYEKEKTVSHPKDENSPSFIDCESIKVRRKNSSSMEFAETLLGGILDNYSPVFVLHATTQIRHWEDQLRADLLSVAQQSLLDSQLNEAVAIVAQIDKWEVEVVSSHSYAVDRRCGRGSQSANFGGIPVMMSPLVSQISDSLLNLIKIGSPSQCVAQCLENQLRDLFLKSHMLSSYLLDEGQGMTEGKGSASSLRNQNFHNLSELSNAISVDLNDIPLLLAVASTHTPALTHKFGVAFK